MVKKIVDEFTLKEILDILNGNGLIVEDEEMIEQVLNRFRMSLSTSTIRDRETDSIEGSSYDLDYR
jgi:hypothetical protein